jgi:EAL domain-containing protein (putative c-di-GMP-specific phosphodiesterase class I)
MTADRSSNPLCFLIDEDFVFRNDLAKQLRRDGIDVVDFSDSSRIVDMADDQSPDIVFVNLNGTAPHECIRTLLALKECEYPGIVQLFGRCEMTLLESLNKVGADCSLTMLPPIQKPIKAATVQKIILDQKFSTTLIVSGGALLSDALLRDLVKFMYQPKFDLKTNIMVGVEVVARVAHPKLGLLTPDEFLKGAGEEDLLKLSRLALVNALKSSAHFHELGISLLVAINIGVENLLQLAIPDLIMMHRPQCSEWTGILLEVPERQVINKIERLKARLPHLQKSGISIAIDNFGRGSIQMNVLNQIPVSEIKIDRSLVQGCATNTGNANICKTYIQMAHNFGSRAVAVGISTDTELQTLCGFDCDIGQGYLLGKPMGAQGIDALIENFKKRMV